MTRDKAFALTVQTLLIHRMGLSIARVGDHHVAAIMAHAASLPEEAIPREVDEAALAFVRWYVGDTDKPEWLP